MNKGWGYIFFIVVGLAMLGLLTPGPVRAADTIQVGIILPLTGSQAAFGEIEKDSFDMALQEINASGGIKGKTLEFLIEDDTSRPEVGRSVAEELIRKNKVVMLGGGYSSPATAAVADVAQQNRIPFLINTGSADDITQKGWQYIFRLNPPTSEYASGVESFLSQVVKPKTAVILYENTKFGTSSSKAFAEGCEKLGIKVLLNHGYEAGSTDFSPILVKVKELEPDVVYMVSYVMDASLLMRQSRELRLTPKLFIGGGAGFTLPEFAQGAGKATENVISATLWHQALPLPGAAEYFTKFKAKYNKDVDYQGVQAYAAAHVIADVLKRTRSFSPEDIREALVETDMMTAFGPVKFVSYGKFTNQNILTTYVVQWQQGQLKLIWPAELANAKYVYPVDWLKVWGYM